MSWSPVPVRRAYAPPWQPQEKVPEWRFIERYGVVGGNLTTGYVGPVLGMVGKGTMRDEIVKILEIPDNDMIGETGKAHDFEKAKLTL